MRAAGVPGNAVPGACRPGGFRATARRSGTPTRAWNGAPPLGEAMPRSVRVALLLAVLASTVARADPLVPVTRSCAIPQVPSASAVPPPTTHRYKRPDAAGSAPSLDLYAPSDGRRGPRPPLVVVIHGGAWTGGSRRQAAIADEARRLAGQGYAVASVDYGLVDGSGPGTGRFPASVQDALCAVKWLKGGAAALGFDPARIAVLGHSSGGYLAAMIGVLGAREQGFDARFGVDPLCGDNQLTAEVAGVAAYYPVTDAVTLHDDAAAADGPNAATSAWGILRRYLGPAAADDPMVERVASPFWWVGRGPLPPFFVVAGARDSVVPVGQTTRFAARLAAFGHTVQRSVVGHGDVQTLDHGFYPFDDAATAAIEDGTYGLGLTAADAHALLQPSSCTLLSFLDAATSDRRGQAAALAR